MGSNADGDRRQTPCFPWVGEAKIIRLPSKGLVIPAKLRDLSLGGSRSAGMAENPAAEGSVDIFV